MKIAVIGAAAGIGLATVQKALANGHEVVALSTNTANISEHTLLTKINGSATSLADMKKAMSGADAVLITIGTKNKKPNTLFSDTAKALVQAGKDLNFKGPVLVITGFGSGKSSGYLSLFMKIVIGLFLKNQYINKTLMEEIVTQSNLKWEIIRPGMLSNGPLTQNYKVLPALYKGIKVGKISRADVAHYLLTEVENPKLLNQYPALTY
ncbi:epimerase [Pedobacter sp. HMWF019]|uniref:NAD(P)-dependent oxidoreductase n=1 Tax=Pedobacter sp. HMWF019 TaxID=2056856 RepID=UPI000D389C4F|nr:NAD(P)H-binding protein [Pedobacter sp. HMWF019]PTS98669.1 epimerase [Pedobacter sp. HMWF019]